MLMPRIIPCLLLRNKGLVKTIKFRDPKYVGDPINAIRIFNESHKSTVGTTETGLPFRQSYAQRDCARPVHNYDLASEELLCIGDGR